MNRLQLIDQIRKTATQIAQTCAAALRPHGISDTQYRVLATLCRADGMDRQADLAETLCLKPASVTSLLDRLEARGLLCRTRTAGDRRIRGLRLTAGGMGLYRRAESQYRRVTEQITEGLDMGEILLLARYLDMVYIRAATVRDELTDRYQYTAYLHGGQQGAMGTGEDES
jgi:DNA-binding MarR family transcriptional regulator